jgi:hypothetical protein
MFAYTVRRRWLLYVILVAIAILLFTPLLLGGPPSAGPPSAAPPIGTWGGPRDTGEQVTFTMNPEGGLYLEGTTPAPVVGVWTWNPESDKAGVVNCEPVHWPRHPMTAYRVVWLGPNRIELSNHQFRVVLLQMY